MSVRTAAQAGHHVCSHTEQRQGLTLKLLGAVRVQCSKVWLMLFKKMNFFILCI